MNNVLKTIFVFSFGVAASTAYADLEAGQEAGQETGQETGQESLLYPSDTSALFVPAGHAFERLPFLSLGLLSGGAQLTLGEVEVAATASGYAVLGVTEPLDKGTMRLGIERKTQEIKSAIKIPVSGLDEPVKASQKFEAESTSILVSFLANDNLAVGAKIRSISEQSRLSVSDSDASDESILYNLFEFSAAMRKSGVEYVFSYTPGANVRDGSLESNEEPTVSLGATLMRERFNLSAGIGLHAYNAIYKEYDDKASFVVGMEGKVTDRQQFAFVAEYQPKYYKSIAGFDFGSIGGTNVGAMYKARFGNSMQADLAYQVQLKSTKSETDESGTTKLSSENSLFAVNLKKYF